MERGLVKIPWGGPRGKGRGHTEERVAQTGCLNRPDGAWLEMGVGQGTEGPSLGTAMKCEEQEEKRALLSQGLGVARLDDLLSPPASA